MTVIQHTTLTTQISQKKIMIQKQKATMDSSGQHLAFYLRTTPSFEAKFPCWTLVINCNVSSSTLKLFDHSFSNAMEGYRSGMV